MPTFILKILFRFSKYYRKGYRIYYGHNNGDWGIKFPTRPDRIPFGTYKQAYDFILKQPL